MESLLAAYIKSLYSYSLYSLYYRGLVKGASATDTASSKLTELAFKAFELGQDFVRYAEIEGLTSDQIDKVIPFIDKELAKTTFEDCDELFVTDVENMKLELKKPFEKRPSRTDALMQYEKEKGGTLTQTQVHTLAD